MRVRNFALLEAYVLSKEVKTSKKSLYTGVSKYLRSTDLKPPRRSALSVFWFMLNTWRVLPISLANSYTIVVFPVPVSPTSRIASLRLVLWQIYSRERTVAPVYTNLLVDWELWSTTCSDSVFPFKLALPKKHYSFELPCSRPISQMYYEIIWPSREDSYTVLNTADTSSLIRDFLT